MSKYWFSLGGVKSSDVGIRMDTPVKISEPEPIVDARKVAGRNGEVVFPTGAYKNRKGTAMGSLIQQGVAAAVDRVNAFLLPTAGYQRLQLSQDQGHYMLARVRSAVQLEPRADWINPVRIRFDCKPQRFVADDSRIIVDGEALLINDHAGIAHPLLTVTGTGPGSIDIGGKVIEIRKLDSVIFIDCETGNAYGPQGPLNSWVDCEDFPELPPGRTSMRILGGVREVQVEPRWWDL